ncbi:MAG: ComEC family competence protein [Salinarimonadaceae bacterium]|nr:MAG: ComEC family competence protein [Salinarimonadaceae bacterium]
MRNRSDAGVLAGFGAGAATSLAAGARALAPRLPDPRPWLARCLAEEVEQRRLAPWAAVAFGLGIVLCFAAEGRPSPWAPTVGLAVCAAIAMAGRRDHRIIRVATGLAMIFAGFAAGTARFAAVDAPVLERILIAEVHGRVETIEERARDARVVLRVISIEGLAPEWTPSRVRVTMRDASPFGPGDHVIARARLTPPPEAAWPGGFDFAKGAYFAGIGAVGSTLGSARLASGPEPPGLGARFSAAVETGRTAAARRISSVIGGQPGAVAAALVTGKRGMIAEETNEALRAAGIYHIVSISGLHMVLAAGTIFWLVRAGLALSPALALRWPIKKIAAVAALCGALAYCVFSGAQVATVRALIMTGVMLGAILFDRPALSMRNLAVAAVIVLALWPETLLGPSFQMSFGAVAGLIAGAEWMRRRGRTPAPPTGLAGRAGRFVVAGFAGIATTTIIASLATGPYAAYHFQIANPYGLVGNGLALPIVSLVVMPAGVIGMLGFAFGLDRFAWEAMGFAVALVIEAARFVESFEASSVPVRAFGPGALAWMTASLLVATLFVSQLRRLAFLPAAFGLYAAGAAPAPDLYVDRDGNGAAIRGADGRLVLLGRPGSFVTAQWLKAAGDWRGVDDQSLSAGVSCDPLACVADLGEGRFASFVRDPRAFAEDCRRADIVISPLRAPADCAAALVVDRRDLAAHGAMTARFGAAQDASAAYASASRPLAHDATAAKAAAAFRSGEAGNAGTGVAAPAGSAFGSRDRGSGRDAPQAGEGARVSGAADARDPRALFRAALARSLVEGVRRPDEARPWLARNAALKAAREREAAARRQVPDSSSAAEADSAEADPGDEPVSAFDPL